MLSELCPPGFKIQQQLQMGGHGGCVAVVYRGSISLTRKLVFQSPDFECLHLMLSDQDKSGLVLGVPGPSQPNNCPVRFASGAPATICLG